MFAILKTGGKQYKVAKDDIIQIEKLDYSDGDLVKLTEILLIEKDGGDVLFGAPFIDEATDAILIIDPSFFSSIPGK